MLSDGQMAALPDWAQAAYRLAVRWGELSPETMAHAKEVFLGQTLERVIIALADARLECERLRAENEKLRRDATSAEQEEGR